MAQDRSSPFDEDAEASHADGLPTGSDLQHVLDAWPQLEALIESMKAETENTRLKMRVEKIERWRNEFEAQYGAPANPHTLPADMAARIQLASQIERNSLDALARQAKSLAALIEKIEPATHSR